MIRPDKAFILAAGMGNRLRPYTDHCPKPLVRAGGRPIIGHVLDRLKAAGVRKVTVNLHYKAEMLQEWLQQNAGDFDLTLSYEPVLLNTGGGLKNALPTQDENEAFYAVSGDSFWTDGPVPILHQMADLWDAGRMDLMLALQPLEKMTLTPGKGDYVLRPDGKAERSLDKTGPYMWTSIRICTPKLFRETPDGAFSFLDLMDRAEAAGRLHGLVHDGDWHHITTPDDLDRVNAALQGRNA